MENVLSLAVGSFVFLLKNHLPKLDDFLSSPWFLPLVFEHKKGEAFEMKIHGHRLTQRKTQKGENTTQNEIQKGGFLEK